MKKICLLILFLLFFSCKEKTTEVYKKEQKNLNFKKEKKELKEEKIEKDPLLEAMKLLVEYKKDPSNEELKKKVCDAFKKLEKKAIEEGNTKIAEEYGKIASICNGGEKDITSKNEEMPSYENNFPALKISLSNFDIQISGLSKAKQAEEVLLVLDNAYNDISSRLSLIPEEKIKVILYTDKEFYDLTGFPPWIGGAYDGRIHLPLANANPNSEIFKKVIKHELTHAILHDVSKGRCPTWLHEGLAQYMEGENIKDEKELLEAIENGRIPSINSPSFLILERDKSVLLYKMSLLAVNFLEERGSMGSISNFIKKIGEGESIENSFYESFLFPYNDLTERIKEYLKRKK
jgi:hypothetical protein